MTRWLTIVGIGDNGYEGLAPLARQVIDEAEFLIGGARHLAMIPPGASQRKEWDTPLAQTIDWITTLKGRRMVVLASGDPMWFGVGNALLRAVPIAEVLVLPSPSAFSLACARLGWSVADSDCLTLHGRPLAAMNEAALPGQRLVMLSEDGTTPAAVARRLSELGYGPSRVVALEHLGGPRERIVEGVAENWSRERVADLNVVAVEVTAGPMAAPRARVPGLPDEAFLHDGQITKREVRAITLAALMPLPGKMLWDVGAGCGSIAIEWLRAERSARAVAIERNEKRAKLIEANAAALGVPLLTVCRGEAPAALAGLPAPDAVFIGGGLTIPGLLETCWQAIRPGGRLVANAVTVESEARLLDCRARLGGSLTRIAISRAEAFGEFSGWRSLRPVTQWTAVKP